jgi:hypothetical protein
VALWSRKGPSGTWGSTSATILSFKALVWAAGGAKHKGLTPFTILVKGKEVKQGEVTDENADRLQRFDFTEYLRPGVNGNYPPVAGFTRGALATIQSDPATLRYSTNLSFLSLMALSSPPKRGSLFTVVDRFPIPTKENPREVNIINEVAALQRLSIGQLRQRFAELFGEATNASNRTWVIKRPEASVWAIKLWDDLKHYAGTMRSEIG